MADLVGKTILHYRIIEQVGQGGIGIIYQTRTQSGHQICSFFNLFFDLKLFHQTALD